MTDDPPRRPRRASLGVVLIVAATVLIAGFLAMIALSSFDAGWAEGSGIFDVGPRPFWASQGGALMLLTAGLVVRLRRAPGDELPRRSPADVILTVAAMLVIAGQIAMVAIWWVNEDWAWRLWEAVDPDGVALPFWVSQGGSLLLLTAALVVSLRRPFRAPTSSFSAP